MSESGSAGKGGEAGPDGPPRRAIGARGDESRQDWGPSGLGPGLPASPPGPLGRRGEEPDDDLCDELPTIPPANGNRPAILRWAVVDQPLARRPGPDRPQRHSPPNLPISKGQPASQVQAGSQARTDARSSGSERRQGAGRHPAAAGALVPPRSTGGPVTAVPVRTGRAPANYGSGPAEPTRSTPAITAPKRVRRPGRAFFWLLAAIVVIAASASAVVVLAGGARGGRGGASQVSSAEALFGQMMATNTAAERLAASAVARSCQETAPGGAARTALVGDLGRAVALRRSVLRALASDRTVLLAVPDGEALGADLSAATTAALAVDEDDQGWLQDLQATGCYSAPTNDIHYRDAALATPVATGADQRLTAAWAKVGLAASGADH